VATTPDANAVWPPHTRYRALHRTASRTLPCPPPSLYEDWRSAVSKLPVFISWSGERARLLAEALKTWIPSVLQATETWCSSEDIAVGKSWFTELGSSLQHSGFGVVCVTAENALSPWIHYEAGALAIGLDKRVAPICLGIAKEALPGALNHLQGVEFDEQGI